MRIAKLGELTKIKTGKLDANASVKGGRYPFFTCSIDPLRIDSYSYDCECVLLAGNGDLNVKYYEGRFDAYQRTYIIESADRCLLDTRYLYYFLTQYVQQLRDGSIGAVIKYIKKGDLTEAVIPLPEITIQKKIICNLDSVSKMLDKEKKKEKYLDDLVKSRFVEMFGDPCDSQRSTMPCYSIKKFCEVRIGPFGSALHKSDYVLGSHALVNPSHIVKGKIKTDKKLTVNEEKYASMKAYHLKKGDVVLGRRGEIGRCAVVNQEGLLCGTGSMILRPNVHLCLSEYLQRVVSFPTFAKALERDAVGVTMKNLNAKIVENAVIALPSMSLQREFISFVAQVDKLKFDFDFLVSFSIPSICLFCLKLDP